MCVFGGSPGGFASLDVGRPVTIMKKKDGTFRVKVGCHEEVIVLWCDVASAVRNYLDDPAGAEARYHAREWYDVRKPDVLDAQGNE